MELELNDIIFKEKCFDEYTNEALNPKLVREVMMEELGHFRLR